MPLRHFRPRNREQAVTLWSFVGTVLAAITGWVGAGYAVLGNQDAMATNYHVLRHAVPGGMHTVGAVLLVAALSMVYTVLTPFNRQSKWTLRVFAGLCFLVGISFASSWLITHRIGWGSPFLWLGLGALAEGLVIFPPDTLPTKEDPPDAPGHLSSSGGERL